MADYRRIEAKVKAAAEKLAHYRGWVAERARGIGSYIGPGWETEPLRQRFRDDTECERDQQAKHNEQLTRQQEERINREERERFARRGQ